MSTTIIKTENVEGRDVKPRIKEGGGIVGGIGGSSCSGVVANVGPKVIVGKNQAALKVANETKQLKLRLKGRNYQQQPKQQQSPTPTSQNSNKKRNNTTTEELQEEKQQTNKRFRLEKPASYASKANSPIALSTSPHISTFKCGEIFVTNNAKKWTFVCTHCQKTTRDIGEFVCHIQFKHIKGHYNDNDEEEINEYDSEENLNQTEESYNNQDQDVSIISKNTSHLNKSPTNSQVLKQVTPKLLTVAKASAFDKTRTKNSAKNASREYFDCTNYLDVNVHTDADDTPNNKVKLQTTTTRKNATTKKEIDCHQLQKNTTKYVVDLIDDGDNHYGKQIPDHNRLVRQQFDYEIEDDEDGVEIVDNDNDDAEEEEDHLSFLRSNSIEDPTGDGGGGGGNVGGKGGSRKYRSHVRGKAYCNLCDKTFQYYSLYRNHMIKHSNITPYKCQYCSKAFKSKQAIRYHMNTHTKEVQYTCPLCPTTYGTENQFITHVLNHESDTCFPCMVCAKILKTDQERDQHLETHTEERPFGCEYCNKRFRQRHHLSNHLKLHCQYRCDFCKEEFSSTQTQRRPYACPTCEDYPDIRIQVEKQRSKSLNNPEINPLEIPYENMPQDGDTECVDLAEISDDEESETSTNIIDQNGQKRITCQYCTRSYKHNSALNYHMRQKHAHIWNEVK